MQGACSQFSLCHILIAQSFANFGNITENVILPPQKQKLSGFKGKKPQHCKKKKANGRRKTVGSVQLIILNRINLTGEKEDKKIKDQKFKILN